MFGNEHASHFGKEKFYMKKTKKLLYLLLIAVMVTSLLVGCKNNQAASSPSVPSSTTAPAATSEVKNKNLVVATTTSVRDSGLLDYLQATMEADTGLKISFVAKGTGAAIQEAKDGNASAILVHAKTQEETFVTDGYGIERIPFMYNYFVLVGPKTDPVGIKGANLKATEAFQKIADKQALFVSRGDASGTDTKEKSLWKEIPTGTVWYLEAGSAMGNCLTMASEKQAYCLTDKATYLSMKDKLDLNIVIDQTDDLKNTYSIIICNPDKNVAYNKEAAQVFANWMFSEKALNMIAEYGKDKYGEALFTISYKK